MVFNSMSLNLKNAMIHFEIMTIGIENLGQKIHDLRKSRWRSQKKFSDYLQEVFGMSIHQTTLSSFERGEKSPSVENLALLARALETNTDYLLGLTDDDRPHGMLDDQVVVTVDDPKERAELQEAVEMLVRASTEDKEQIVRLIRRLVPKKPRIIGDE